MTALDLDAISAEFLTQCGSCDAGLPMSCACTDRDYRPTMLALIREVERLRAQLAAHREFAARVDVYAIHDELTQANVEALHERLTEACDLATELRGEGQ